MRVDIGDGVRLFFDVEGAALAPEGPAMRERPTVVVLHGGPGLDHAIMRTGFDALADVAQLVYYDHRGHGRSDARGADEWNLDTWADDVVRLCDALGIDHPIVIGVSFGGMVAQRYLARHPAHPGKIVLGSTCARLDVDTIADAFATFGGEEAGAIARRFWEGDQSTFPDYVRVCMPVYSTGPVDVDVMLRSILKMDVMTHFQEGEQHSMDHRESLGDVCCPVLVYGGEADPIVPIEMVEELVGCLPSSMVQFERIPGVGHLPTDEQNTAVLETVRAFVTRAAV